MSTESHRAFFKSLFRFPAQTGAIWPSGVQLGRKIADLMPGTLAAGSGAYPYLLELGPGTGSITRALIRSGLPQSQLFLLEIEPAMASLLKIKYPQAHIATGNALEVRKLWHAWKRPGIGAIVSSLPITNFSMIQRRKFLDDCLSILPPGAPCIQWTYSPFCPAPNRCPSVAADKRWAPLNLPPACVWRFARMSDARPAQISYAPVSELIAADV